MVEIPGQGEPRCRLRKSINQPKLLAKQAAPYVQHCISWNLRLETEKKQFFSPRESSKVKKATREKAQDGWKPKDRILKYCLSGALAWSHSWKAWREIIYTMDSGQN